MNKQTKDKLQIKIMRILADYKYNQTSTETTQMVAERIINIVKECIKEKNDRQTTTT